MPRRDGALPVPAYPSRPDRQACALERKAARANAQAGMALLAALMIAALATLLATRLLAVEDDFLSLVSTERDIAQAQRLALAGMDYARAILHDDARRGSVDHPDEPWATVVRETPVEHGVLAGRLADAQARFNLGNLLRDDGGIDTAALAAYTRLLELLGLERRLGDGLSAWLMARQSQLPSGTRYWPDLADLRQVEGYSEVILDRLRPYLVTLPVATPVNVNTAPPLVLAAVAALDAAQAGQVEAARRSMWFRDVADFRERAHAASGESRLWGVSSQFFEVVIEASQGSARTRLAALLARGRDGVEVLTLQWGI